MVEQDRRAYTPYRICERHKKDTKYIDISWTSPPLLLRLLSVALFVCGTMPASSSANPLPSDESTVQVRELQFSAQLKNPCRLSEASSPLQGRRPAAVSAQERRAARLNMVRELKARVLLLNDSAATILRTNVLRDCSDIKPSLITEVPSADDLSNDKPIDVLRGFYTSLLNHTAHVYFISEQLSRYSGQTCSTSGLPKAANSLSSNMRELMCVLRLCMLTLSDEGYDDSYFHESTSRILNEPLLDLPVCARRMLRDCRTVYSTVTLLTEMTAYLRDRVLVDENEPS